MPWIFVFGSFASFTIAAIPLIIFSSGGPVSRTCRTSEPVIYPASMDEPGLFSADFDSPVVMGSSTSEMPVISVLNSSIRVTVDACKGRMDIESTAFWRADAALHLPAIVRVTSKVLVSKYSPVSSQRAQARPPNETTDNTYAAWCSTVEQLHVSEPGENHAFCGFR
jgi:hypothetical protein